MSPVNGTDALKRTSPCVALSPHSVIREGENCAMYHPDKDTRLNLFMNSNLNFNTLSGSVSERLIYRGKGL